MNSDEVSIIRHRLIPLLPLSGLLVQFVCPEVGAVQSFLVAGIVFASVVWWRFDVDDAPSQGGLYHLPLKVTVAVVLALYAKASWFEPPTHLGLWYFRHLVMIACVLLVGWGAARRMVRLRNVLQAVVIGFATTAAWVPVGQLLGLDYFLRMHPTALVLMAFTSAILLVVETLSRWNGCTRWRLAILIAAQLLSLSVYVGSYDPTSYASLGYLVDRGDAQQADGRLVLRLEGRAPAARDGVRWTPHATPTLILADTRTGIEVPVAHPGATHAGMRFLWSRDGVRARWSEPTRELRLLGGHSQQRVAEFALCPWADDPILCGDGPRQGSACEWPVDCASGRCTKSGACAPIRSCVSSMDCPGRMTCVSRICRHPDNDGAPRCDDDRDCDGVCVRASHDVGGVCGPKASR